MSQDARSNQILPAKFRDALEACAAKFEYSERVEVREFPGDERLLIPGENSLARFLPLKADWMPGELLGLEGIDFAFAAARSLGRRKPKQAELALLAASQQPYAKLEYLLALDADSRKSGEANRLGGAAWCRFWWRLLKGCEANGWTTLAKLAKAAFRSSAARLMRSVAPDAAMRAMLLACLDRMHCERHSGRT
jgi:hypothetical protein